MISYGKWQAEQAGTAFGDLCREFQWYCLLCGVTGIRLTRDHVVPRVMLGSNEIKNMQPLCVTCNTAKGPQLADFRPVWRRQLALAQGRDLTPEEVRFCATACRAMVVLPTPRKRARESAKARRRWRHDTEWNGGWDT